MPGLDPGIWLHWAQDCRIKSGNDDIESGGRQGRESLEQKRRSVLEPREPIRRVGEGLPARVRLFVGGAWWLLLLERLAPALFPALLVAGAFLAVAFFGLPRLLPAWPH